MATDVLMPKFGVTMTEGKIGRWLISEGEAVKQGEPIAEIITDKASIEIEAPANGFLHRVCQEESSVPVYTVIGHICESQEEVERVASNEETPSVALTISGDSAKPGIMSKVVQGQVKVSPAARKLAGELGIDIREIRGSGPGGRIVEADVLQYRGLAMRSGAPKSEVAASSRTEEIIELSQIRKSIADHLTKSHTTTAPVTSVTEADFTELRKVIEGLSSEWMKEGIRATLTPFVVKAVALSLQEFPLLNSSLEGERLRIKRYYHIGVAFSDRDGLLVPVIRDADRLTAREIGMKLRELRDRMSAGSLRSEDLSEGTFTVSNVGAHDVLLFTPMIHMPQAAILGVGTVVERPAVKDGQIVTRWFGNLCLTYDHRIVDGVYAAEFRKKVKWYLANPSSLVN